MGGSTSWRGSHRSEPRLIFYPFGGAPISAGLHVVQINTQKLMAQPAGTWTITLKRRVLLEDGRLSDTDWLTAVSPGDWMTLGWSTGHGEEMVILGNVDHVERRRHGNGAGARVETFTISGRDFAKAYTDAQIITLPGAQFDTISDQILFTDALNVLSKSVQRGATPFDVVKIMASLLMRGGDLRGSGGLLYWRLPRSLPVSPSQPGQGALRDLQVSDVVQVLGNGLSPDNSPPLQGSLTLDVISANGFPDGQRVFDVLQSYANSLLNEMFFDLRPDASGALRPSLVIRERPFAYSTEVEWDDYEHGDFWPGLKTHHLDGRDLEMESLGRSDRQRLNLFLAISSPYHGGDPISAAISAGAHGGLDETSVPAMIRDSAERNGLRFMSGVSRYLDPTENPLAHGRWTRQLRDWYVENHRLLSGTLTATHLRPDMRIGERVRLDTGGEIITAYIEGVSHSWQRGREAAVRSSTTLTVTRGTTDPDLPRGIVEIEDVPDDVELSE